ncbi:MlaD family protein [Curvibacter delicatus]|jgi:phospholipid/cholesterol/gamma-HCH transport system substrate-binding protein|uniref:MlaD family protein n=1 Tax=Curvibacter delicatus TaxID=80879 RepID=UPI00083749A4|nr:MlaD family protein [Curvibacter delicatus]
MENKAHAIAAGAFVLLLSALLVALAVWLTRESGEWLTYDVTTDDPVTGLQQQASVRFRGVKVGKVADISFDPQVPGNVLVRIAVAADTPVTRSTFATLGFQGVTGIAFVQLDDTGQVKERLPTSDEQPARIPMRLGLVGQLSEQSGRILAQLEETSRRINQLLASENQKTLVTSIDAIGQAAASLPPVMKEAGTALQSLRTAAGSVAGSADEVKKTVTEYGRLAQRLQQPGGALDQLSQESDILPRLSRTLDETGHAARQVRRVAGTLQDNPQALLLGSGLALPGPGEPGFVIPLVTQGERP